jgi:hypothetical protein
VPDKGHVHEPAPVAAAIGAAAAAAVPIALPGPGRGITASHVLGLSRTIGNAAVARGMASGALLAREPAAPAADPAAPAGSVPAPPVAGAPALSQTPFATLLGTVEGWSPREDWLQARLATPGVDGKRLNLADTIVMRKETGVDEAGVVEIAQERYIVGTPVADRDAVFTYLGFALPSSVEAFANASAGAAAAIATMSSFEERAGAVQGAINARLSAAGVPKVGPIRKEGGGNAHFDKTSWSISVDPDFAMRGGADAPAALLSTVYHEARHAEQDFLVARHMARDKSAARTRPTRSSSRHWPSSLRACADRYKTRAMTIATSSRSGPAACARASSTSALASVDGGSPRRRVSVFLTPATSKSAPLRLASVRPSV